MYLGIDVSKKTIDCCLIKDGYHQKQFTNGKGGFEQLKQWLLKHQADETLHCCCEATGTYYESLAESLSQDYKISVENPKKIKGYGIAVLQRSKTDRQDAKLIAQYCQTMKPRAWEKPAEEQKQLQELLRYLDRLKQLKASEETKEQTAPDYIKPYIKSTIKHFDAQIKELKKKLTDFYKKHPKLKATKERLKTISGIGEYSAAYLMSVFLKHDFENQRQFVAYLGLDPKHNQSGTSINGKSRISKMGNAKHRKILYMPALVAYRMNAFPRFVERLRAKGKPNRLIIVAIMRKLAVIFFNLMKTETDFDKTRYL